MHTMRPLEACVCVLAASVVAHALPGSAAPLAASRPEVSCGAILVAVLSEPTSVAHAAAGGGGGTPNCSLIKMLPSATFIEYAHALPPLFCRCACARTRPGARAWGGRDASLQ